MRKEFILPLIVVAVASLLLLFILLGPGPEDTSQQGTAGETKLAPLDASQPMSDVSGEGILKAPKLSNHPPPPTAAVPASVTAPVAAANSTEAILAKIDDAIVTYSPEGVGMIVPYLSSSDPEVQAAAIEGLKQLGEPEGAKALRLAAKKTADPGQRAHLLEAAEFIELPPIELEWIQPSR